MPAFLSPLHTCQVILAIQARRDPAINTVLSVLEATSLVCVMGASVRTLWAGLRHRQPPPLQQQQPKPSVDAMYTTAPPSGSGPSG